ncbi:pirin family protein [Flectobacillus sp. DC10W]|uniref:Pirin family protein n=1 Tax=Flectobacillus longus TaxID=2984207 RepID=A0ABT6YPS8_9BACT|nr:pirin family protein [Flectobacillus longus]MDI9865166.1 pirin family protein [Flectobacillus longus]
MERKEFLKKGILGTGMFVSSKVLGKELNNHQNDELQPLEVIGLNHLSNPQTKIMANTILHKADTRGYANHGWLKSHHTFSFANYYNPERVHFGVLRVLNDDQVAAGRGFGTHPHDNMEIISIPLEGDLEHKDSMNNVAVIKKGDIQVMSAGTGVYHSEYNRNSDKETKFLQIWVFPNKKNVAPRYDQMTLDIADRRNRLQQILSPNPEDAGVWIHQDAWFNIGTFDAGTTANYDIKRQGNGVYAFILKGDFEIDGQTVNQRDGLGIWNTKSIALKALTQDAEILLMDVPMTL